MTITLHPEQRQWLEEQVAAGAFPSIEEAVRTAINKMMTAAADFEWARS